MVEIAETNTPPQNVRTITVQSWPSGFHALQFGYLAGIGAALGVCTVAAIATAISQALS